MAGLLMKLYARPLLERRARRRRQTPLQLDARWTASVSGEPQPQPIDEALLELGGVLTGQHCLRSGDP